MLKYWPLLSSENLCCLINAFALLLLLQKDTLLNKEVGGQALLYKTHILIN